MTNNTKRDKPVANENTPTQTDSNQPKPFKFTLTHEQTVRMIAEFCANEFGPGLFLAKATITDDDKAIPPYSFSDGELVHKAWLNPIRDIGEPPKQ